jgi:hypothetical protein
MPATETQLNRFRRYFNDSNETIFEDTEIDDIFDEVAEDNPDASDALVLVLAKIIGIDTLRMDAAKLTKYQQLQSTEDKTTIFKALTTMRGELVDDRDDLVKAAAGSSVRMAGIRRHNFRKDKPSA